MIRGEQGLPLETLDWSCTADGRAPGEGEVDVWWIDSHSDRYRDERFFACLSDEEQERASRFRFERDRRSYRVSHACKRYILSRYVDADPAELQFSLGEWGKPGLRGSGTDGGWQFNLSHSKGVTLVGVSRGFEVGVDVEAWQTEDRMKPIFQRFSSHSERHSFGELRNLEQASLLTAWWVSKEAFIKAVGRGLSQALSDFSIQSRNDAAWNVGEVPAMYGSGDDYRLCLIPLAPGHLGAVVGRSPALTLRGFQFESVWFNSK